MNAEARDYWCIAALGYDKDEAWVLAASDDASNNDLLSQGPAASDNRISDEWMRNVEPGLYRLRLRPWSCENYEGEWDGGVDVVAAELMVAFPPLNAQGIEAEGRDAQWLGAKPESPTPQSGGAL